MATLHSQKESYLTGSFYDEFAPYYHLIFENWDASIDLQAAVLSQLIRSEWGDNCKSVLDVSCGIGTQAIGLAQAGFSVTASDISAAQIERAKIESDNRNVDVHYSVSDMRKVKNHHKSEFDILISCDNSVPHLLSDSEIELALNEFYCCLRPGGGCIITVRDYDNEKQEGIQFKPHGVRVVGNTKYTLFQTWEFNNEIYKLSMYCVFETDSTIETKVFKSQYYAVSPHRIVELMIRAGFKSVKIANCDYYQPVIVGTKSV
jgi:SAM-dependent methyltransferase